MPHTHTHKREKKRKTLISTWLLLKKNFIQLYEKCNEREKKRFNKPISYLNHHLLPTSSISLNHMILESELKCHVVSEISITPRLGARMGYQVLPPRSVCVLTKRIIFYDDSISTASGVAPAGEDCNFSAPPFVYPR